MDSVNYAIRLDKERRHCFDIDGRVIEGMSEELERILKKQELKMRRNRSRRKKKESS